MKENVVLVYLTLLANGKVRQVSDAGAAGGNRIGLLRSPRHHACLQTIIERHRSELPKMPHLE